MLQSRTSDSGDTISVLGQANPEIPVAGMQCTKLLMRWWNLGLQRNTLVFLEKHRNLQGLLVDSASVKD